MKMSGGNANAIDQSDCVSFRLHSARAQDAKSRTCALLALGTVLLSGDIMNKVLPTFRAGGVFAGIDSLRADDGSNHKTALTPSYFSHNHFSSSLKDPMSTQTRVSVKVMEGKDLLVSDLLTGTSDPVAFLWVGSCEEGEVDLQKDKRVQRTEVRKHTVDPVWDAEFLFPLEVQSVEDVMSGRVNILMRDHDDADGDVHYLDLGQVSVSLETVLTEGTIMAHTQLVQLPAQWYPLRRCRGMRKSGGELKIAVGLFVGSDSVLLANDDNSSLDQDADTATLFKHNMRRIRRNREMHGRGQTMSMSPTRQSPAKSRTLTARGGTTSQRPKSAPEAATLTSPKRVRQQPFELKPLQARFPPADIQTVTTQPNLSGQALVENPGARGNETFACEERPRWRGTYGSPDRHNDPSTIPGRVLSQRADVYPQDGLQQEKRRQTKWAISSPPVAQNVRSSTKLSRLTAKATREIGRDSSPSVTARWDETGADTLRAHRWQRRLLESMQRLESRSTEGMAYGELRAMVRKASSSQVGQIVAAARGVGCACSVAARRYTLRLLAWLCWDQPRAANNFCSSIVAYALDRMRDDETASLRKDLAACVGAVMLSALRNSTAEACMAQSRRFLELVREQRMSVRESAGACCVALVLPPPALVSVEIETNQRSIDDVRLAIGQAAGRVGITNVVPKEAVLLPGGRAVIELPDTASAANFFDRVSLVAGDLPPNWSMCPFPEDFCAEIELAGNAHHARLTVNSEEILASLLEALDTNRSEGTRAQLFNAIAAMAQSCDSHQDELDASKEVLISTGLSGLSATLNKGLPAVAHAVAAVLDSPVRRAYTWKERKAALEAVVALANLRALRGLDGPLGVQRAKLIKASSRGKHDSVAAVREAAGRALAALEATEAEKGRRETGRTMGSSELGSHGGAVRGARKTVAELRKSCWEGEPRSAQKVRKKTKNLDGVVTKAERAARDAANAVDCNGNDDRRDREGQSKAPLQQQPTQAAESKRNVVVESLSPSSASMENSSPSRTGSRPQNPPPRLQTKSTPDCSPENDAQSNDDNVDRPPLEPNNRQTGNEKETALCTNVVDAAGAAGLQAKPEIVQQRERHETAVVKHAFVQATVVEPSPQPLQTTESPAVHPVQVSEQSLAPQRENGLTPADAPAGARHPASVPPPMHGGLEVDTIRLLKNLYDKTDSIAIVLNSLDQRLTGMQRNHVDRSRTADSPNRMSSRKLKRPRSGRTAGSDDKATTPNKQNEGKHRTKPNFNNSATPAAAGATGVRGARSTTRVRCDIGLLVDKGDIEGAFRLALRSGTQRDVLRLMGSAGGPDLCRRRLGMETRDRLFAFVARTISGGQYAEHALPWVFELVRAGKARALPLAVRMQLAGALHGLAASPTDQGVMAARLGPYLSLTSVGRSCISDAAEGGGVFSSMEVVGGGV